MPNRLRGAAVSLMALSGVVLFGLICSGPIPLVRAQTPGSGTATASQSDAGSSKVPDLSGDWVRDGKRGGFGGSLSLADPGGKTRGKEEDIPYQPWSREKTMSEITNTGPDAQFGSSTNPTLYCDPAGVPEVYMWPAKTKLVQAPDAVYILYEFGVNFRAVRLNSKHPDEPDPQWWGHSIGWYENGDTLVVDTIGFNDKTWLDEAGHPHTEKLHLIERYKRVDKNTMRLDMTIDDPGAYTKPWSTFKYFSTVQTGFLNYQWQCSVRENERFFDILGRPAVPPPAGK